MYLVKFFAFAGCTCCPPTVDKGCESVTFARGGDRIITKMLLNDVKMREIAKIANNHSTYSDFPKIRPKGKKSLNLQKKLK